MIVNVDAAESTDGNVTDVALLDHVDAVNLALGGHAGSPRWTRELAEMARERGLRIHLHPGIARRDSFGRVMPEGISWDELAESLSRQRAVLPEVSICKFHGALYNLSIHDRKIANNLVAWSLQEGVEELVVFPGGELEEAACEAGLKVMREAFVDRGYQWDQRHNRLVLAERKLPGAVIGEVEAALDQARSIIGRGRVRLLEGGEAAVACETLCLHGDGAHVLEVAVRLRREVVA